MRVIRTGARLSARAAARPPNPPPTMTTCGGVSTVKTRVPVIASSAVAESRADRDVEVQGRVPDVARPAPPLDRPRPRLRDIEVHRHDRVHVTVADRAAARALLRVQARLAATGPALEEYGADEQVTGDIGRQLDPASEKGSAISARHLGHARVR